MSDDAEFPESSDPALLDLALATGVGGGGVFKSGFKIGGDLELKASRFSSPEACDDEAGFESSAGSEQSLTAFLVFHTVIDCASVPYLG